MAQSVDALVLLDLDLYKLVNQSLVFDHYRNIDAIWKYTSRSPILWLPRSAFEWIDGRFKELGEATVNEDEIGFLRSRCPFFSDQYLCFLRDFKFAPDTHLCVEFTSESIKSNEHEDMGQVSITASGKWLDTTLYENVILQTLNEAYFRFCDTDWTLDGQEELAYQKGCLAISQGIRFADFGSRRRRCIDGQEADLRGLIRAQEEYGGVSEGCFLGTSNVHLAHKLGLVPQATMSHEWFMGVGAAVQDYEKATSVALSQYLESFGRWIHHDDIFGLALPDTFGSHLFLSSFANSYGPSSMGLAHGYNGMAFCDIFTGLRHDSGEPLEWLNWIEKYYENTRRDVETAAARSSLSTRKTLMFSESLTIQKCIELKGQVQARGFDVVFSMTSHLTNDFEGKYVVPNIVFKLAQVGGVPAVKISDVAGKALGDPETIKKTLALNASKTD